MTAPAPDIALAEALFDVLARATADGRGVSRASYGAGEQFAHELVRGTAAALGLETAVDAAGNLYATLPGRVRGHPVVIGSHLDSVPQGGNFDGAAGVLMGLAVVAGFRRAGVVPPKDIVVIVTRAEESVWFDASFIGSRGALGQLRDRDLDGTVRSDTGRSLRAHLAELGLDPQKVARGETLLDWSRVAAFVEPHIEQGPVLVREAIPVGIVTSIRGSRRYRKAVCHGQEAHSGAAPLDARADAVLATAKLVVALDADARRLLAEGRDIAVTAGIFTTDPKGHAFSKVAGRVDFAIDCRSAEPETLDLMAAAMLERAAEICRDTGAVFALGEVSGSPPVAVPPALLDGLGRAAATAGVTAMPLPSGGAHDAGIFARAGVPSAMLFIRNANGSHNPDEAMAMEDFAAAARVLAEFCADPDAYGARGSAEAGA